MKRKKPQTKYKFYLHSPPYVFVGDEPRPESIKEKLTEVLKTETCSYICLCGNKYKLQVSDIEGYSEAVLSLVEETVRPNPKYNAELKKYNKRLNEKLCVESEWKAWKIEQEKKDAEKKEIYERNLYKKLKLSMKNKSWQDDQPWNKVDEVIQTEKDKKEIRDKNGIFHGIQINVIKLIDYIKNYFKKDKENT